MPDIEEQLKDRMEALAAAQVFKKSGRLANSNEM